MAGTNEAGIQLFPCLSFVQFSAHPTRCGLEHNRSNEHSPEQRGDVQGSGSVRLTRDDTRLISTVKKE